MTALDELIKQIPDENLRERIKSEVDKLTKKFGLVFESKDEFFPRSDLPVKKFSLVAKVGKLDETFIVTEIDGDKITCSRDEKTFEFSRDKLICVNRLGSPIYPGLTKLDEICNAPNSELWHLLIEAENYHALQLLKYPFAGKVDCIYIDPPYNTGARDWKYNNDYVDAADRYSHSKWLSMMERRLLLAKELLNPADSVLIVTIDEHEYLHLGCLLEELFGDARIQMVSSVINPAVVSRVGEFGRSGEYIFFVMFGACSPARIKLNREWVSDKGRTHTGNIRWDLLKRSGTGASRKDSPGGFYPIYINRANGKVEGVGEPLPNGISVAPPIDGCDYLLPIRNDGSEGRWQWTPSTFRERLAQGRVRIGGSFEKGFTVYILKDGEYKKILGGEFNIIERGINSEIIVDDIDTNQVLAVPSEIWKIPSHDATQYGSRMLINFFGDKKFSFPKSLYAVRDALKFFVANKPDALILDFFAGSGTTLHAVNLLNAEDGGNRRCILVTNNEGDIARSVTWQRTVCSIKGRDINGTPLNGNYLGTELAMSDGFKSNAAFFALNCLDKNSVELGEQFNQTLPVLWLKAGGIGHCPTFDEETLPPYKIFAENKFAVLFNESYFAEFQTELDGAQIETFFAVTGSESALNLMAQKLRVAKSFRLYEDYLENFKLEEVTR